MSKDQKLGTLFLILAALMVFSTFSNGIPESTASSPGAELFGMLLIPILLTIAGIMRLRKGEKAE